MDKKRLRPALTSPVYIVCWMVSYAYHPGPHVVPAFQCRGGFCNAEKKHPGRYQQVCDYPEPGMLEDNPNLKMHWISPVILVLHSRRLRRKLIPAPVFFGGSSK